MTAGRSHRAIKINGSSYPWKALEPKLGITDFHNYRQSPSLSLSAPTMTTNLDSHHTHPLEYCKVYMYSPHQVLLLPSPRSAWYDRQTERRNTEWMEYTLALLRTLLFLAVFVLWADKRQRPCEFCKILAVSCNSTEQTEQARKEDKQNGIHIHSVYLGNLALPCYPNQPPSEEE